MIYDKAKFDMRGRFQISLLWYIGLLLLIFVSSTFNIASGEGKPDKSSETNKPEYANLTSHAKGRGKLPSIPTNNEIRPDLRDWHPDYEALCWELIKEFGLQADCDDLLKRIARCEEEPDLLNPHRLSIVSYVHRDPFKLEKITHEIIDPIAEQSSLSVADSILIIDHIEAVLTAFDKSRRIGPSIRSELPPLPTGDLKSHLNYIKTMLNKAGELNKRAFATLTEENIQYIIDHREKRLDWHIDDRIYRENWQTLHAASEKLLGLTSKVDVEALFDQAQIAARLVSPEFTASLLKAVERSGKNLGAEIIAECNTPEGKIFIAGRGATRYEQPDCAVIYDLGGDDVYANNIATSIWGSIPTSIIVDYAGDDAYETHRSFAQGCGDFGVGLLVDLSGNDSYVGTRFTQGTSFCGVGMLFDQEGDDVYRGLEFHQGVSHWGAGVLIDSSGNDRYESHNTSQAVGMVGGFGLLCDCGNGRDSYYCKGRDPTSYGEPGIFEGWGQGMGIGYRRNAATGGIGVLYDQGGKDRFEAGNFSQGGGYFYAFGILYNDGSDNDNYIGSRYAQGFGCHQAAGVLVDAGGDDRYQIRQSSVAQGYSWDEAVALFIDEKGDDQYEGKGCCSSCMNGWTIFLDRSGKDKYLDKNPAIDSWISNRYSGGTSLSFFVDLGGQEDIYPTVSNNNIIPGGEWAIFLDLPGSVADALDHNAWQAILKPPRDGRTALYIAILAGHKDMAKSLIYEGIEINSKDKKGQVPLHVAARAGHLDVMQLLLDHGSDVNVKDKWGCTPLSLAEKAGHTQIVELLRKHGAKE